MDGTVQTMTGEGKRAALYMRISKLPKGSQSQLRDEGGASYSVENQDERCTELCEREGYVVVSKFYDDGVSAYRSLTNRPGYGDMKAALAAGEFDVLVFDRQDRLARDQTETLRFVADCKQAGIEWHSVREHHVNLSEPMQVLFAIFRGGEAERYSATISANQMANNVAKRKAGLPGAGPRPFGYEKWDPKNPNSQPLREEEANLIRRGTAMILEGAPRYQVTKVFNESGVPTSTGKTWHSAKVGKVLSRWRNAGVVEFDDEPCGQAIWPAIVSEDDVRNVRKMLSRGRAPGQWKKPTMLCSGIARCRCGYQLVATGSAVGPSYRCGELIAKPDADRSPGPHVTIASKRLDPMVRDAVVDAYFARPASSGADKSEKSTLARLQDRRAKLMEERGRVESGFIAGILSESKARAETARIDTELDVVEGETRDLAASSAHAAMLEASMNALVADLDVTADASIGDGTFSPGVALAQSAMRSGKTREASLDLVAGARWAELDGGGMPITRVDPAVREAVASRFDSLDLEQQRHLVRSLVAINVQPGQGMKRVCIEPIERAVAVPA